MANIKENKPKTNRYGDKTWHENGKLHRLDGPAYISKCGYSEGWYQNGQLHREDGPARSYTDGRTDWYKKGVHHREDGPAVIYANGTKFWIINGDNHRIDGPAVEWVDGRREWWINGIQYFPVSEKLPKTIMIAGQYLVKE